MEKAIKSLGQNFLTNKNIVKRMVDLLPIKGSDYVVEIGPGPGVFTTEIVSRLTDDNTFYAIDLDERFVAKLKNKYQDLPNVHIILANFLDWSTVVTLEGNTVLLGSIPYYITSPILHHLIKMTNKPKTVVLMLQKEVAEKLTERKVKSNYLSIFINTFYEVTYIDTVDRGAFTPVPNVDSAIILMTEKEFPAGILDITSYENFLHVGFKHQKKMLNKAFPKELLEKVGLTGNERPHNLTIEKWLELYKVVENSR